MNCVIERRQAEEIIDDSNGLMYNGEPKKRVTGERMAIFCESGTETKCVRTAAEHCRRITDIPIIIIADRPNRRPNRFRPS